MKGYILLSVFNVLSVAAWCQAPVTSLNDNFDVHCVTGSGISPPGRNTTYCLTGLGLHPGMYFLKMGNERTFGAAKVIVQ